MSADPVTLGLLTLAAVLAGWVDAIAGGGGLIQVPALVAAFPGAPVQPLLGANKLSSICGTATALWRYRGLGLVRLRHWIPAVAASATGAGGGAAIALAIPSASLKPMVLALVVLVLIWMLVSGTLTRMVGGRAEVPAGGRQAVLGGGVGFYDGLFGPGTGSFLVLAMVRWFRMEPVAASAAAKAINLASNAAALSLFAVSGSVLWQAAIPMAAGNVLGGWIGAGTATRFGKRIVQGVLVVVVLALTVRAALDLAG